MAQAFAVGITPAAFWAMTPRETFNAFEGAALARIRSRQLGLWTAYHGEVFARHKRLPPLAPMLKKLEPSRVQSSSEIRGSLRAMAEQHGWKVTVRKRGS